MGGGPSRSAKLGNANANKYTRNNDDEEEERNEAEGSEDDTRVAQIKDLQRQQQEFRKEQMKIQD
jgi:hypothetical protein